MLAGANNLTTVSRKQHLLDLPGEGEPAIKPYRTAPLEPNVQALATKQVVSVGIKPAAFRFTVERAYH